MSVAEQFTSQEVVSDVTGVAPSELVQVTYRDLKVDLGNVLTPTQVQNRPVVSFPAEDGAFYTLLMTDPDAPSRANPTYREWHHWLVVNIPGNDVNKGEEVIAYVGSGPPQGTGLHRYVFLVYKQQGKINFTDPKRARTVDGRGAQKAKDIVAKYNLGNPVAGNFYQAEWDDYVPKLMAELTGK